jgi:hypothetical protein
MEQQILELEEQFWRGGADVYRRHLAADALMVFGPVGVLDRDGIIASVEGGQRWDDVAFSDVRFVRLTGDACVVTYRADAQRAGEAAYTALVGSVYVRRDGAWQLAFHQHTVAGGA